MDNRHICCRKVALWKVVVKLRIDLLDVLVDPVGRVISEGARLNRKVCTYLLVNG